MGNIVINESYLKDIADALRDKLGTSDKFYAGEMADVIENISSEIAIRTAYFSSDAKTIEIAKRTPGWNQNFPSNPKVYGFITTSNVLYASQYCDAIVVKDSGYTYKYCLYKNSSNVYTRVKSDFINFTDDSIILGIDSDLYFRRGQDLVFFAV